MTKDVLVSVSGVHAMDGDTDNLSVITAGSYYLKNGRHYILYDEVVEGVEGTIRNTIKAGPGGVDMIKGGSARAHMVFEPGKTNVSCYATPFGQMMLGVITDDVRLTEEPDRLHITIDYTLEVNYEKSSQCHIEIDVSSKEAAQLKLGE